MVPHLSDISQDFFPQLQGYAQVYTQLTEKNLNQILLPRMHPQVRFKDPFNDVSGHQAVLAIFAHMFASMDEPEFRIQHLAIAQQIGYIHWQFDFALKGQPQRQGFDGLSQIFFDERGLVTAHIDFWDAGEHVYAKVPLLGAGVRWVSKKLSVKV